MGTWKKCTFGGKGYPKQMFICPKYLQMGTGANGHLGEGLPQVSCAHFPQMFTNGHLRQMDIWGKGIGLTHVPYAHFPKCMQMGTGANGHWGQMESWGKGVPQMPQ